MTPQNNSPRIFVTGATGQLGRKVVDALLQRVAATSVVAGVRDMAKAADLQSHGVELRMADYDKPETLAAALRAWAKKRAKMAANARLRTSRAPVPARKAAFVRRGPRAARR